MKYFNFCRRFSAVAILLALMLGAMGNTNVFAQARRQPPATNQKKNKRPDEEKKEEPPPQDTVNKRQEAEKLTIATNLVNVDAVVYQKKGGQIVTGLRKGNFAIFVDGVQQQITNFATPEAPITIVMVIEYSKWTEIFGFYGNGGFEPGTFEVIRPAAMFLPVRYFPNSITRTARPPSTPSRK